MTKADAAVICEFHEGWLVDMDEGRGDHISIIIIVKIKLNDGDGDNDFENNGDDDDAVAGPQKNNLMKSLIGDADPGSPGFPGNQ